MNKTYKAWRGPARQGGAWRGSARRGAAGHGHQSVGRGQARPAHAVRRGLARHGWAGPAVAGRGEACPGKAWASHIKQPAPADVGTANGTGEYRKDTQWN